MRSQSFNIDNIYIDSIGVIVSKKEKEGPLGKYFTHYIDDYYFDCKTFEKAQTKLAKAAICKALEKSMYSMKDIKLCIAGDLSNQLFSSTCAIKDEYFPFIGLYAACGSGILSIILACIYINSTGIDNALTFTSSHVCVSQRQFRYPIEYACLTYATTTETVTAATAIILNKKPNTIKVSKATVGKVVDILSKNVNDMGTCMAYAAIDTFKTHLANNKELIDDYDLIVTGDLGEYGSKIFKEEIENIGIKISNKHIDCGQIIYNKETQHTNAGGSGPGCVMAVTFSYIMNMLIRRKVKKVLVIATGALHSQISYQQKETIPCIAHAIVLEGNY